MFIRYQYKGKTPSSPYSDQLAQRARDWLAGNLILNGIEKPILNQLQNDKIIPLFEEALKRFFALKKIPQENQAQARQWILNHGGIDSNVGPIIDTFTVPFHNQGFIYSPTANNMEPFKIDYADNMGLTLSSRIPGNIVNPSTLSNFSSWLSIKKSIRLGTKAKHQDTMKILFDVDEKLKLMKDNQDWAATGLSFAKEKPVTATHHTKPEDAKDIIIACRCTLDDIAELDPNSTLPQEFKNIPENADIAILKQFKERIELEIIELNFKKSLNELKDRLLAKKFEYIFNNLKKLNHKKYFDELNIFIQRAISAQDDSEKLEKILGEIRVFHRKLISAQQENFVLSLNLDNTTFNTPLYESTVTPEFLTTLYFCEAENIPYYITTNRTMHDSKGQILIRFSQGDYALSILSMPISILHQHGLAPKIATQYDTEKKDYAQSVMQFEKLFIDEFENFPAHEDGIKFKSIDFLNKYQTELKAKESHQFPSIKLLKEEKRILAEQSKRLGEQKTAGKALNFLALQSREAKQQLNILHIDDNKSICDNIGKADKINGLNIEPHHLDVSPKHGHKHYQSALHHIAQEIGLTLYAESLANSTRLKDLLPQHHADHKKVLLQHLAALRYLIQSEQSWKNLPYLFYDFQTYYAPHLNETQKEAWNAIARDYEKKPEFLLFSWFKNTNSLNFSNHPQTDLTAVTMMLRSFQYNPEIGISVSDFHKRRNTILTAFYESRYRFLSDSDKAACNQIIRDSKINNDLKHTLFKSAAEQRVKYSYSTLSFKEKWSHPNQADRSLDDFNAHPNQLIFAAQTPPQPTQNIGGNSANIARRIDMSPSPITVAPEIQTPTPIHPKEDKAEHSHSQKSSRLAR